MLDDGASMTEIVSVEMDGPDASRLALEECIWDGGVALFPADTLYGLACDPLDSSAIARIHEIKGRDDGKPSAVMYFAPLAMRELLAPMGEMTREAVAALLPGPVTLVIANPERRYPLACRDDPERLGVRLIEGPLAGLSLPVFQTSANHSGYEAPASFDAVDDEIAGSVDIAIDGGALGGQPSTVVDVTGIDSGGGWRVLREGALGAAEIGAALDPIG
jgi:L-threonylcarbamoyladenylate synthase